MMSSSSSYSNIENGFFPEEVILQILARLPVKSLFRFRCVCKFWDRLPSNKYFIQLYNQVSSTNPMMLVEILKSLYTQSSYICVDTLRGVSEFSLEFLKDRVKVRASCNGLLCCASVPNKGLYYVCNPMTRDYILLPRTRERPMTRFHPDDEATLVGLGFDASSTKFSVVLAGFYRPFGRRPFDSFICLVFDSETSTWRRSITSRTEEFTHMNKNQVVYSNGSLHWLTYSCLYILVLDLDHDIWRKISLPDRVVAGTGTRLHLLELDGSVSVIQISDSWMTIWVLKDYNGEEWFETDRISLRCIKGLVPSVFPISQTGECVFLATQRQILEYHRKSRVWKEVYAVKNSFTYPLWFSAYAFRSTIVSCHQGRETGSSAEEAELLGIVKALTAAQNEGFVNTIVISHSLSVTRALHGEEGHLAWDHCDILNVINCSLQAFSFSKCVYLPRTHVVFAHSLIALGSSFDSINMHFTFNLASKYCCKYLDQVSPNWVSLLTQTTGSICNNFVLA